MTVSIATRSSSLPLTNTIWVKPTQSWREKLAGSAFSPSLCNRPLTRPTPADESAGARHPPRFLGSDGPHRGPEIGLPRGDGYLFAFALRLQPKAWGMNNPWREGLEFPHAAGRSPSSRTYPSPPWGRGWNAPAFSSAGGGRVRGSTACVAKFAQGVTVEQVKRQNTNRKRQKENVGRRASLRLSTFDWVRFRGGLRWP